MSDPAGRAVIREFMASRETLPAITQEAIEGDLARLSQHWKSRAMAALALEFKRAGIFPSKDISPSLCILSAAAFRVDVRRVANSSAVAKALGWFAKRGHPQTGHAHDTYKHEGNGQTQYSLKWHACGSRFELLFWPDIDGGGCRKVKVGEKTVAVFEVQCDGDAPKEAEDDDE